MEQDWGGAALLWAYYLVACLLVPTWLKNRWGLPPEVARKLRHIAYALSIFLLLHLFSAWYAALGASFLLVVVGYPGLLLVERLPWYRRAFADRCRRGGELRRQLLYVQVSFALLIVVFWGWLGGSWQYLAALPVMAWGWGDAAAALVGKARGQSRVIHRWVDSLKTYEGALAMLAAAGLALFLGAWLYLGYPWYASLLAAVLVAPGCALTELLSRRGLDTLTVPWAAAFLLYPLVQWFSYMGW